MTFFFSKFAEKAPYLDKSLKFVQSSSKVFLVVFALLSSQNSVASLVLELQAISAKSTITSSTLNHLKALTTSLGLLHSLPSFTFFKNL
jgi:hypothetical protein